MVDGFRCIKRSSKDNKDGLTLLQLRCNPSDIPPDIKYGNSGDRYYLKFQIQLDEVITDTLSEFEGQRVSIDDLGDGTVTLKIVALPAQVGDKVLYAKNGTEFIVNHELVYVPNENLPNSPEARNATFKRFHVLMQDPAFWDFLEAKDRWNLLNNPFILKSERPHFALEIFYRLAHCHTRSEIRTNAAVCERTERLIRQYRSQLWDQAERQIQMPKPIAQTQTPSRLQNINS